jgi:hypothetical protein
MPDCSYCGDAFDAEGEYLDHLAAEHESELSAIDHRRLKQREDDDSGLPIGPLVLGGVIGVALLLVVYVTVFLGDGSSTAAGDVAQQPGEMGSAHEHGTINVTIDGRTLDFSRERYQLAADRFHFEDGTDVWHKHATGVTVEYAMSTLGIEVSENSVRFDGTTYNESDPGTSITITVNGEPVDPATYVVQGESAANAEQGDHIRIGVETNSTG